MDYIDKGKQLAQDGKYEDALDALVLALENDKENPDIHFYIGLCYSSLEQFGYAKYHYQQALSLNPAHEKTKIVWDGIKSVTPEKPPEKRIARSAAHKALKEQQERRIEEQALPRENEREVAETPTQTEEDSRKKYKLTDDKWEKAFPIEMPAHAGNRDKSTFSFLMFLIAIGIIGAIVYFLLIYYR